MAECVEITADGFLRKSSASLDTCSSFVVQTVGEYNQIMLELNPDEIGALFFFSFGLVLLSYKTTWVVSAIKQAIGRF